MATRIVPLAEQVVGFRDALSFIFFIKYCISAPAMNALPAPSKTIALTSGLLFASVNCSSS